MRLQPGVEATTATAQVEEGKRGVITAVGACRDTLGVGLEAGGSCCKYKEEGLEGGHPKQRRFDVEKK